MNFVSLNGMTKSAEAVLFYELERFRYADAIFESILYHKGNIPLLTYHQERLDRACNLMDFEQFLISEQHIEQLIAKNEAGNKTLRIRLSLVRSKGENYLPHGRKTTSLLELKELGLIFKEVETLDVYKNILKHPDYLSNIKSSNSLIYVMAKRYAQEHNLSDVLLLNTREQIVEATSSNVFIVKDNELFTPNSVSACVNGVTRQYLIDNFKVNEIEMSPALVESADEIFLTNGIQLLQSVKSFKGRRLEQTVTKNIALALKKKLSI